MSALPSITVNAELIKLARSLLNAQREAALSPSPRARQRAEQLKTLFETKLAPYERQITAMEQANQDQKSEATPFAKLI